MAVDVRSEPTVQPDGAPDHIAAAEAAGDLIRVLDHGFVRFTGAMADDLSVVNAARVSFADTREEMSERDGGLIRFLMRERHGTPFEHNSFRFHIKAPIFVAREHMRHRTNSFNEWSARYSKLEPQFYLPAAEDVRTQVGKPGAYTFDPVDPATAEQTREAQRAVYEGAYRTYEQQAYLYDLYLSGQGAPANPPGTSSHEYGTAVDVDTPEMRSVIDQIGPTYGWTKVHGPDEWWHVDYVGP